MNEILLNKMQVIFALLLTLSTPGFSLASTYAPWLTQMGVTDKVMSDAKWGSGQVLGVVDSGIRTADPAFFDGQILVDRSSCAATTFHCPNGFYDDEGHGTAVAEIAVAHSPMPYNTKKGEYLTQANSTMGIAPYAAVFVEKVLNDQGYAYSADVANGIKKAADAGASVINVSISFDNDWETVSAINYAANKNVFVVWAGGNSGVALLGGDSVRGLTPSAVDHLIFAGSVDASNHISQFSNKPGKGFLINTQGDKTLYSSRWAVAPGEDILAHDIVRDDNHYYAWTGTSMSAPLVSGALLLLENAWPILKTNGTAANLLLETATSLGSVTTYGQGLINLTQALKQPNGSLSLKLADGSSVPLSMLRETTVLGNAMGPQSAIRSKLEHYTSFDHYARDFDVNLSGLMKTESSLVKHYPLPKEIHEGINTLKLQDGSELSYAIYDAQGGVTQLLASQSGYIMHVDPIGNAIAWGYGFPVQFAYAKALYMHEDWAKLSNELGVSNLANLAQGDGLAVYGKNLDTDTRFAASWSSRGDNANLNVGLMRRMNNKAALGIHYSLLNENNGLLGSSYGTHSILNFGNNNKSNHVGLSALLNVLPQSKLLLELALSETTGRVNKGLLVRSGVIESQALGMGIMQNALFKSDDSLVVAIKKPLRISAGKIGVMISSLDRQGYPVFETEYVTLAPSSQEIDYKISYGRPLNKVLSLSLQAIYYKNVSNRKGENDASVGLLLKSCF